MAVIGLVGLDGSGRRTIAAMLSQHYTTIHVRPHGADEPPLAHIRTNDGLCFASYLEAEKHVTANWKQDFVVPVVDYRGLEESQLLTRPFFLLVSIVCTRAVRPAASDSDDANSMRIVRLTARDPHHIVLVNSNTDLGAVAGIVRRRLSPCAVASHIRPPWDAYFMRLAHLAERRSNCMKRRVGAIAVVAQRVASTGYNGTPRSLPNCSDGGCGRCNGGAQCGRSLEACLCLHAEENAIVEAGRGALDGGTLYCTTMPCLGCAKRIVQVGIRRVVWARQYSHEHDSQALLAMAGVTCEQLVLDEHMPRIIDCSAEEARLAGQ